MRAKTASQVTTTLSSVPLPVLIIRPATALSLVIRPAFPTTPMATHSLAIGLANPTQRAQPILSLAIRLGNQTRPVAGILFLVIVLVRLTQLEVQTLSSVKLLV